MTPSAEPGQTTYGGGNYTLAWDGDTATFFDYTHEDGGYTEVRLDHEESVSCLRSFPHSQVQCKYSRTVLLKQIIALQQCDAIYLL